MTDTHATIGRVQSPQRLLPESIPSRHRRSHDWCVGVFAWLVSVLAVVVLGPLSPTTHAQEAIPAQAPSLPSSIPMPAIPTPDPALAFLDFSKAWPARLPLGVQGRPTITIEQPRIVWDFRHMRNGPLFPRAEDESDAAAALQAAGIEFDAGALSKYVRFEGRGSFITRFERGARPGPMKRTLGAEHFEVVSLSPARVAVEAGAASPPSMERTWFVLYEPLPFKSKQADAPIKDSLRGVALVMPGIFGTPEGSIEGLVASLRARGWCVLRMLAQPSRFTQRIVFQFDPAASSAEVDANGQEIATALGDRAAECAYAVQGAFEHVNAKHPNLAKLPRVAIGCSGGAITLPIVVAREPEAYNAAILIGGGCHYWLVNDHSTYAEMVGALAADWKAPPTLDHRRAVADAYLRHAPLDAFHTAAALRGKPVLMVQANADSAVAAVLGDVLWERLGKPERWIRAGEHLPLFISLAKDLPAINAWIDSHVPREAGEQEGHAPQR